MGKESGKELQIQRTNLEIKLISFLAEHIDELARERGYDSALLKKKFGSLILEREILLHNLEGEKFKALKKALLFHDPALRDSVLYRAFKKLSMLMSIAVPYSRYVWLRQKYGSSFVFRFVHGFLK